MSAIYLIYQANQVHTYTKSAMCAYFSTKNTQKGKMSKALDLDALNEAQGFATEINAFHIYVQNNPEEISREEEFKRQQVVSEIICFSISLQTIG